VGKYSRGVVTYNGQTAGAEAYRDSWKPIQHRERLDGYLNGSPCRFTVTQDRAMGTLNAYAYFENGGELLFFSTGKIPLEPGARVSYTP
jgi:hypothetical protein